jgi:hypothetical protein
MRFALLKPWIDLLLSSAFVVVENEAGWRGRGGWR